MGCRLEPRAVSVDDVRDGCVLPPRVNERGGDDRSVVVEGQGRVFADPVADSVEQPVGLVVGACLLVEGVEDFDGIDARCRAERDSVVVLDGSTWWFMYIRAARFGCRFPVVALQISGGRAPTGGKHFRS